MSYQALDLPNINWPKLRDTILASSVYALTEVNNWSIKHPYVAAGALICISANPDILLTPLRLTGRTTLYICLLPLRRHGVVKDSLASQYQSHHYGGYVPRDSTFARFQSYGAADYYDDMEALRSANGDDYGINDSEAGSTLAIGVSWLSAIGGVFVLGRTWGWWN
ncbi:hypothetical protein CY34DRAFT_707585 [Suillus luteus UH-Slu-Lm8-n1]|uniref:Uncharacterized protein n=1 Tax=Suillus luteus UH-Slu-Lm8-n1 TaxID=930992 RepID=A0A0D0A0T4_9AGAM|nr:hypothetical protein CY34DRAFT_707585 [Suillus luteus UH-Slu-Lm8-n1]